METISNARETLLVSKMEDSLLSDQESMLKYADLSNTSVTENLLKFPRTEI